MKVSLRFEVFKRDAFTCRYCGKRSPEAILEVDHVMPRSNGGTDDIENLVTACYACNRGKGAKLLTDIPPEENLHDKAVLIAERELQIAELQHWQTKQREREDSELKQLQRLWKARYGDGWWKSSRVRPYLRKLGYYGVGEALEYTIEHAKTWPGRSWAESAWVLFLSICSREHRQDERSTDAQ